MLRGCLRPAGARRYTLLTLCEPPTTPRCAVVLTVAAECLYSRHVLSRRGRKVVTAFLVPSLLLLNGICLCPRIALASSTSEVSTPTPVACPSHRGHGDAQSAPSEQSDHRACPHCASHKSTTVSLPEASAAAATVAFADAICVAPAFVLPVPCSREATTRVRFCSAPPSIPRSRTTVLLI